MYIRSTQENPALLTSVPQNLTSSEDKGYFSHTRDHVGQWDLCATQLVMSPAAFYSQHERLMFPWHPPAVEGKEEGMLSHYLPHTILPLIIQRRHLKDLCSQGLETWSSVSPKMRADDVVNIYAVHYTSLFLRNCGNSLCIVVCLRM
jgi:hypothetical protein